MHCVMFKVGLVDGEFAGEGVAGWEEGEEMGDQVA